MFEGAQVACRTRAAWSAFADQPSGYPDYQAARVAGENAFRARLHTAYVLDSAMQGPLIGEEISPYTQQPLGVKYAAAALDPAFAAAAWAIAAWSEVSPQERVGVLLEVMHRIYRERLFELAYAVMHTAGQSFNMSYAGSGVNALDRGIEALVYAYKAMSDVSPIARWQRKFGPAQITLEKRYRLVPRGVAVCFTCASFPTWNAFPSMLASLATGNAVIVKPHPATVLPMAISVDVFRAVLAESGFDPNLVSMVVDMNAAPVGKRIIEHASCAIVDFTGSTRFGKWVEENAHPALCFTETAGCNTVVLESCYDLDSVVRALATTLCLFSAQMCTSPQNIFVPAAGVRVGEGASAAFVPLAEVEQRLANAVDTIGSDNAKAAAILAAIQSPATPQLMSSLRTEALACGARVLLEPRRYAHAEFPDARTSTPMLLGLSTRQRALYAEERFGPIAFVICARDAQHALAEATRDVHEIGGLTAFLYSTDEKFIAAAEMAYARAGAQLTVNLTGPMPLNFAAAYSDYHVTGLNPAGNASLTDAAFVASRFRIAQVRRPVQS